MPKADIFIIRVQMKLQNEMIVFIRKDAESWANFELQDGVQALPKYDLCIMIPEGKVGSVTDYRVLPSLRQEKFHKDASRWATHYAILTKFLQSQKTTLFVCEDELELFESYITQIETAAKGGIQLLSATETPSQAYIIDRDTAKIIQENAYTFYANLDVILNDLQKLKLIQTTQLPILKKLQSPSQTLLNLGFFALLFLAFVGLFLMLCPLNSFITKDSVSLSEVLAPEETIVGTQGAGVSSLQNSVVPVNKHSLFLCLFTPQHKHAAFVFTNDKLNNFIGNLFPTLISMR